MFTVHCVLRNTNITTHSAEKPDLREGSMVYAIMKASEVMEGSVNPIHFSGIHIENFWSSPGSPVFGLMASIDSSILL